MKQVYFSTKIESVATVATHDIKFQNPWSGSNATAFSLSINSSPIYTRMTLEIITTGLI